MTKRSSNFLSAAKGVTPERDAKLLELRINQRKD